MDAVLGARAPLFFSIAVICGLVLGSAWAWGYTVDDALISVRYAHNVARGLGWRFNPGSPASDGVTPLPWPLLLAPFGRYAGGLALLDVAKALGVMGLLVSAVLVLRRLAREEASGGAVALLLPFPLVAWSVSGMETGVATALVTAAACAESLWLGAAMAGLATTLRPELLPWALALVLARVASTRLTPKRALALAVAAAPFALVALLRLGCFGRAAPLAVLAKPSDATHGAMYLLSAGLACGTPLLLAAPWRAGARPVALAAIVHLLVVVVVGGDWMPYARLLVPILPSLALVPALRGIRARIALGLATVSALGIGWRAAPAGIHVGRDRARLVTALAGLPVPSAALDVGFVAVVAGDGEVVDLGGLTDPEIAVLSGGQTSKRVDLGMLESRGVRSLVTWGEGGSRIVEQRIVQDPRFAGLFVGHQVGILGTRGVWLYERR